MKSMFSASDSNELLERINSLSPDAQSEWGKMNVAQMLAHCKTPLKVAFGNLKLKRGLMGILFGKIAKMKLTSGQPFGRNLPTDKNFVVTDERNFEEEKKTLIEMVRRFSQTGPNGLSKEPHPFFGSMSPHEWDVLMWQHLDHHLRQFGA